MLCSCHWSLRLLKTQYLLRRHTAPQVPTREFVQKLTAARLAADVMDVPTVIIARTDALGAYLLTSDADERDKAFMTGGLQQLVRGGGNQQVVFVVRVLQMHPRMAAM